MRKMRIDYQIVLADKTEIPRQMVVEADGHSDARRIFWRDLVLSISLAQVAWGIEIRSVSVEVD